MKFIPVALVLAGIGLAVAVKFLPWWGSLWLILSLAVVVKLAFGGVFRRALLNPFRMRGAVLKGATVEVHSIVPLLAPLSPTVNPGVEPGLEAGEAELDGLHHFYELDLTITPPVVPGRPGHWEPGELELVEPAADPDPLRGQSEDDVCTVHGVEVEVEEPAQFGAGCKISGPQRLRLLVAAAEGVRELKFRYHLESFGRITLPEPLASAA